MSDSVPLHPLQQFLSLFYFSHSHGCGVIFHRSFNLHLSMANYVENLYMCLFAISVSFLVKCPFMPFVHFIITLCGYFYSLVLRFSCIF